MLKFVLMTEMGTVLEEIPLEGDLRADRMAWRDRDALMYRLAAAIDRHWQAEMEVDVEVDDGAR